MVPTPDKTALIGLDWGTTSFRAYRMDADGRILDRLSSDLGIMAVADGDFAAALRQQIAPWLFGPAHPPILASGMIGSRQGWHEAPYVALPAGAPELADSLISTTDDGGPAVHFVPGLSYRDPSGAPDVMRGEETQLIGAMESADNSRLFILPGTHSKWVVASAGRIRWFATFLTGEMFAVLKNHSILGRLMSGTEHDPAAFQRGLEDSAPQAGDPSGLLHRLFGVRSLPLFGALPETGVESYLSGLLIGTELAEATRLLPDTGGFRSAVIVGRSDLARHYKTALVSRGISTESADPDICATGLYRLAVAAGLLPSETT